MAGAVAAALALFVGLVAVGVNLPGVKKAAATSELSTVVPVAVTCSVRVANTVFKANQPIFTEVHTAPGAWVSAIAQYGTTTLNRNGVADGSGNVGIGFTLASDAVNQPVSVKVIFTLGDQAGNCDGSFTPIAPTPTPSPSVQHDVSPDLEGACINDGHGMVALEDPTDPCLPDGTYSRPVE